MSSTIKYVIINQVCNGIYFVMEFIFFLKTGICLAHERYSIINTSSN